VRGGRALAVGSSPVVPDVVEIDARMRRWWRFSAIVIRHDVIC
jgi:hypothetical protein